MKRLSFEYNISIVSLKNVNLRGENSQNKHKFFPKDFFRECWNIALGDENKFGLFLVHAKNHCEVRLKRFTDGFY